MKELAKQYDPSQVEDRIYQFWLDGGYFHTKADPDKKPYTIVMPPPNVTGQLHITRPPQQTITFPDVGVLQREEPLIRVWCQDWARHAAPRRNGKTSPPGLLFYCV